MKEDRQKQDQEEGYEEGGGRREGGKKRTTRDLWKLGWGQCCLAMGAAMTSSAA